MVTSTEGIELIKSFEGYRSTAYKCPSGVLTLGYGHTNGVKKGDTCTEKQAVDWLKGDVSFAEKVINRLLPVLLQHQFDALVSLVYNIGSRNFKTSTLLKLALRNPDDPAIKQEFLKWNKAKVNGKLTVIQGLTNRRIKESELYFKK